MRFHNGRDQFCGRAVVFLDVPQAHERPSLRNAARIHQSVEPRWSDVCAAFAFAVGRHADDHLFTRKFGHRIKSREEKEVDTRNK